MAEHATNGGITTMNGEMVAITTMQTGPRTAVRRLCSALAGTLAVVALLLGFQSASAHAESKIFSFYSFPSTTQAGGHPDVFSEFELGSRLTTKPPVPCYCNDPKNVFVHSPAGVIANPHVVDECRMAQLALFACSPDSQAGVELIKIFGSYGILPLNRTTPAKGQAGSFAFDLPFAGAAPQFLVASARTGGDYGLDISATGISHLLPLEYTATIFWGVPNEHFFDFLRAQNGYELAFCEGGKNPAGPLLEHNEAKLKEFCFGLEKDIPSSLPIEPMMSNPTTCVGPLKSTLDVFSYDLQWSHAEDEWPATTGCDGLSFDPSLAANPTTTNTDSASGVEVVIKVPQFQDPNTPSPSELKSDSVTFPEGFSLNPASAAGKTTCSDKQSSVGTEEEAHCPEFSKIGTVTLDSSALPAPINGFVYLGEPKSGERFRMVVTANGFGTAVKLLGTLQVDPRTGQLTTSFKELPQTPFQEFIIHFFGSERGLLATPTQCGQYPVSSEFTPWDASLSSQQETQFFSLDHGPKGAQCPGATRKFSPGFEAGTKSNAAGAHTSFALRVGREDGQQNLDDLSIRMPAGFTATLRGVAYCPESAIAELKSSVHTGLDELASPACPASSEIGTAITAAGAGTKPLYNQGKVYLAGPYKGAPLSMVAVVPAVAGPYDLGNVVVRSALHVDPATAQITAVTDPLPRIVEGVPLRTRLIQIVLNRPDFGLNPTDCEPSSVDASITGDQGSVATPSTLFQVADCTDLDYGPNLKLKLTGGGVKRLGHPGIRAVLTAKAHEANSKRVSVTLPAGEVVDNAHLKTVCTRPQFASNDCPAGSLLGTATATSPLLERPLTGSVYLRASQHHLPDMVADLEGQFDIEVSAAISSVKDGRLKATFGSIPDVPVEKFVMNLQGGKKGLVQNERSLCQGSKKAAVEMTGQNGWRLSEGIPLGVHCGSGGDKHHARQHRRGNANAGAVR